MTNKLTRSEKTPKPKILNEYELERIARLHGRQVVVCYGGDKGFNRAKFLKKQNPHHFINFIVAPILPLGETPPKDGVLEKEIKESHCIVVLFDKKGFLKSETAKKEFRIILEHKRNKYIPIILEKREKTAIIRLVKEEFGVDLSEEKQYDIWKESNDFLENLYGSIKRKVIEELL